MVVGANLIRLPFTRGRCRRTIVHVPVGNRTVGTLPQTPRRAIPSTNIKRTAMLSSPRSWYPLVAFRCQSELWPHQRMRCHPGVPAQDPVRPDVRRPRDTTAHFIIRSKKEQESRTCGVAKTQHASAPIGAETSSHLPNRLTMRPAINPRSNSPQECGLFGCVSRRANQLRRLLLHRNPQLHQRPMRLLRLFRQPPCLSRVHV